MFLDHLPRFVGVLAPDDACQGLLAAAAERRLLPERQDRQPFEVLVLGAAPIDTILLPVLRLDVPACVLSVDMDLAFEHHPEEPRRDRLAHFHEEHPCRLVLAAELAGELESALALHAVHGEPQSRQDVLEAHLPEGEDRSGRDRELTTTGLALETAAPDLPAVRMRAMDACRPPFGIRPADEAEGLVGPLLVEGAEALKREGSAVGR